MVRNANGVAVADYDLDGDLDIYIVSSDVFSEEDPSTWSRFIRNDGRLGFTDVTIESNLSTYQDKVRNGSQGAKMGASWGDYDNDGYPDLFLSNYGYDVLWHNNGDGTFSNVTEAAAVAGCFGCYSVNAVWWDHDKDGDLDLYVSDWIKENRFYRNEGENKFTEISGISGLNDAGHTWSSLPIDLNKDGWIDLYVINDAGDNRVYINQGGIEFVESTSDYGLGDKGDGMGLDVCDYNNDGAFDIYITNIFYFHRNPFFVNEGNGQFINRSSQLGIDNTGWGWGVRFFDFDHDFDEDLYVVNGMNSEIADGDRNRFYKNSKGMFSDVSAIFGVDNVEHAMGLEVFDYDLDGDYDMLVGNRNTGPILYKNTTMELNSSNSKWIQIKLEGTVGNKSAFGSIIRIKCNDVYYYRYHSGVNLMGQSIKPVHFGLADQEVVQEIVVTWPNGYQESFPEVASNKVVLLKEGEGRAATDIVLNTEGLVLVSEDNEIQELKIFPNPFKNNLYIKSNNADWVNFKLINVLGQILYETKFFVTSNSQVEINLPDYLRQLHFEIFYYTLFNSTSSVTGSLIKE